MVLHHSAVTNKVIYLYHNERVRFVGILHSILHGSTLCKILCESKPDNLIILEASIYRIVNELAHRKNCVIVSFTASLTSVIFQQYNNGFKDEFKYTKVIVNSLAR